MRDPGLNEAIRAVGGVSELARKIGISQPSVSNWSRVPAERVVAVEAATGVDRAVLRPDLYGGQAMAGDIDDIDAARAQEYALLAALLARAPDAQLLHGLPSLRGDATPLGVAHAALARSRQPTPTRERVEREYFDLFIGLGRGELLPYGSYYLTGFLHERPLARLREDLGDARHRARRGQWPSRRITPRSCARSWRDSSSRRLPAPPAPIADLFEKHLAPWIGRFFADLERAAKRELLPARRHARPGVHGHRNGSLRAAGVSGRRREETSRRERR